MSMIPVARREMRRRTAAEEVEVTGGIEACLVEMLHQHQITSASLRQQTEKAKKEAMKAGMRVSEAVVEAVNSGVQECFLNQKQIEMEIRSVSATVNQFQKQMQQWLSATHALNTAVKEIGDFENWINVMHFDSQTITAAIRNIYSP